MDAKKFQKIRNMFFHRLFGQTIEPSPPLKSNHRKSFSIGSLLLMPLKIVAWFLMILGLLAVGTGYLIGRKTNIFPKYRNDIQPQKNLESDQQKILIYARPDYWISCSHLHQN